MDESTLRWIRRRVRNALRRNRNAEAVGLVIGYGERLADEQIIPPGLAERTADVLDEALRDSVVSPSMVEDTLREYSRVQA